MMHIYYDAYLLYKGFPKKFQLFIFTMNWRIFCNQKFSGLSITLIKIKITLIYRSRIRL